MKKTKKLDKLVIKKVTLKDLDEAAMNGMVGGATLKTLCGPASLCTAGKGVECC